MNARHSSPLRRPTPVGTTRAARGALAAGAIALLVACGGGGGGGGTDAGDGGEPPTAEVTPSPVPASAFASVTAFVGWLGSLAATDETSAPRPIGDTPAPSDDTAEPGEPG